MTDRKTPRPGDRVIDGRGTGTALGSTGLPPLCDPRDWTWIDWDGSRGMKASRIADLAITARADAGAAPPPTAPERFAAERSRHAAAALADSDERIAAYHAAAAALTAEDWMRVGDARYEADNPGA